MARSRWSLLSAKSDRLLAGRVRRNRIEVEPSPLARIMPYFSLAFFLSIAFLRLASYQVADWFRSPSPARARETLQRWARWACRRWHLQVIVNGAPLTQPCVYVANHRTYLDVAVLAGILPTAFLSRADVANWPLIGIIARKTDTLLVEREDAGARLRVARRLLREVQQASVVVFPEGTTTGGVLPAPFRSGVFRMVQCRNVPIVPVTLRYSDRRAYWVDDISAGRHLLTRVLRGAPLRVEVDIGTPLAAEQFGDVAALAEATYRAVCRPIEAHGELV